MRTAATFTRGFTLIEVLIALSLFSLVLGMAYGALAGMTQSTQRAAERIAANDETRGVYRFLRTRIAGIVPLAERREDELALYFEGRGDRLAFTGTLPAHRGGGGLHFMEIALDGDTLTLFDRPAEPGRSLTGSGEDRRASTLLSGVDDLSVSYFGRREPSDVPRWSRRWDAPGALPQLIRLEIGMSGAALPPLTVELHRLNVAGQPQWLW